MSTALPPPKTNIIPPRTPAKQDSPIQIVLPKAFTLADLQLNARSRILALGSPGSGKSTFGLMMPKPLVLDLDNNIEGPVTYLFKENLLTADDAKDIIIVKPFIDGEGKLLPRSHRWQALGRVMTKYLTDYPDRQTIFIDSFTALLQVIMDEIRRHEKIYLSEGSLGLDANDLKSVDEPLRIQDWGAFATFVEQWFIKLSALPQHIFVSAHINDEEVGPNTGIFKSFVQCPGKFRERLPGMFTEAWLFSREVSGVDASAKDEVFIQTVAGGRKQPLGLKSAKQLGSRVKVDLKKVKSIFQ